MKTESVQSASSVRSAVVVVVLFDGVCNLCNGAVQFIIRRDPSSKIKFASLQSQAGRDLMEHFGLDPDALHSIVVIENNKVFQRSDAILNIAKHLKGAWPAFSIFKIIPRFIRDALYNFIARNRYNVFGKRDECMIPTPELKARFL